MQTMPKPRSQPDPSPPEEPKRNRSGENLNVWIRSELVEAVRQFIKKSSPRTTKTAVVEAALQDFLAKHGVVIPPPTGE